MEIKAIKDETLEVWVPFLDAEVLLRYVGLDELRQLRSKCVTRRWDRAPDGGAPAEPIEETDHARANRLLGRAAVRGWKGFTHEGDEFLFNPDNCDLLMGRWTEFSRFVGEVCMDLIKLEQARTRGAKKN